MANNIIHSLVKRSVACIVLFFFSASLCAQLIKKIDSLKFLIEQASSDEARLTALVQLNEINTDRQELIDGFTKQIALSLKLKEYSAACMAYSQLGYFEYEKNNLIAAESIFLKGMKLARQTKNDFAYGRMCNTMMCIYDKKGDLPSAINYLKEGELLLMKVKRMKNLTRLYCNASNVFGNHNLSLKVTEYIRKAYATAVIAQSEGDPEPLTTASWYLANNLRENGQYDSAIYYFKQGLQIAEKLELPYTQGDMLRGLSDVYAELKMYPRSKDYLQQAILKYASVHVSDRVLECEESMAYLSFMEKDFTKVKNYVIGRQNIITEDSLINNRYVYKWMANVTLAESDVEGWKYYSKKFEQADAALTNDKIQKNLLELEAKYKLSKKESELLQKEADNRKRLWVIAALAFGMLSLAMIAFLQFRNNKNKQKIEKQHAIIEKQNALAEERLRIAADMHDDVGAGLSRIRYISNGLKNQPGIKQEDIDRIVSLSDESVEKMNEIIWALNQGNQQLEEILYFTRSQCSEMISNAGLEFSFSIPDKIPLITIAWKDCRNIYLLVKEAVNNAIKHASAKKISIHIEFNDGLLIQVSDDGIGFSEAALQKQGNGLLNYKKRIESLKGKYALTSSNGNGTALSFEVPLAGLIP